MERMSREDIMAALKTLMDKNLVEMSWSEEKNDFVFYTTEEGERLNKEGGWDILGG